MPICSVNRTEGVVKTHSPGSIVGLWTCRVSISLPTMLLISSHGESFVDCEPFGRLVAGLMQAQTRGENEDLIVALSCRSKNQRCVGQPPVNAALGAAGFSERSNVHVHPTVLIIYSFFPRVYQHFWLVLAKTFLCSTFTWD